MRQLRVQAGKAGKSVPGRIVSVAGITAAALLIFLSCAMGLPRLFGLCPYAVLSASMGKAVPYGSLVLIRPVGLSRIAPGDVAMFQSARNPEKRFTHRVVSVNRAKGTVVTKGDASPSDDPVPAKASQLVGRAVAVLPFMGLPAALMENRIAAGAVLLLLLVWAATEVELVLEKRKGRTGKLAV